MQIRLILGTLLLLGTAVQAAGCADSCFQIQQTLCQCRGQTQDERNNCESSLSTQESIQPPTQAQLNTCAQLLPGCQKAVNQGKSCEVLQTLEGKQACGIAER